MRIHAGIITLIITGILMLGTPVMAQDDEDVISVVVMKNSLYAKRVLKLIRGAKHSIRLCMSVCDYLPDTDDIASQLVKELVLQAKRGLEVEVILEDTNEAAAEYLHENGVIMHKYSADAKLNANFLIIDYYISVSGTTVWTSDSINKNNELEYIMESEEIAQMLLDRFNEIKDSKDKKSD